MLRGPKGYLWPDRTRDVAAMNKQQEGGRALPSSLARLSPIGCFLRGLRVGTCFICTFLYVYLSHTNFSPVVLPVLQYYGWLPRSCHSGWISRGEKRVISLYSSSITFRQRREANGAPNMGCASVTYMRHLVMLLLKSPLKPLMILIKQRSISPLSMTSSVVLSSSDTSGRYSKHSNHNYHFLSPSLPVNIILCQDYISNPQ